MVHIDYYFHSTSPFTYLGHDLICKVAAKHKADLVYKPINLAAVWDVSGAVPPGQRPVIRQRLRIVELQRLAHFRGLPINPIPRYWPVDGALSDRIVIALSEAGHDPGIFLLKVLAGVWAREEDISDERVLASYLSQAGLDPAPALADAKTAEIAAIRERNTAEAIAANAVGVPTYVLNGEPFWGQDRIEHLDHALTSGRAPIRPA